MNSLTVDSSLAQSLSGLDGLTEIRDLEGKPIGYFSPVSGERSAAYSRAAAHFDVEEMKRRKESGQRAMTTASGKGSAPQRAAA